MAKRKRSRKGKMPAGLKAYWAGKRRKKSARINPPKRKRARRNAPRRSRSYKRNPGANMAKGFIMDAVYVTGGLFLTRTVTGLVMPYLPMPEQPIVRIAAKGAVAYGVGYLATRFIGHRAGQLFMLGGLVETLSDAVRTYVSPYVPQLADQSEMGSYPGLMGSYPGLSGYSSPFNVGESEFDEV